MGLSDTPKGDRIHIGFFGRRNAGKSSLVNAITGQEISVVSDVAGTTTDTVEKAMELLPLGPVLIIDTPGFDDCGKLGEKRVKTAEKALDRCNLAVLVTDCTKSEGAPEKELTDIFKSKNIPYITVKNKADLAEETGENFVSAKTGLGISELREKLSKIILPDEEKQLAKDLAAENDIVILVTPIDESAPKGRIILPQQQAIRDLLDSNAVTLTVQPSQLKFALENLTRKPKLVITDSQVFEDVSKIVPKEIALTSFSVLMARKKGFLDTAVKSANEIDSLKNGDKILICEGCTHKRQCKDIGTVKLPKWLTDYTGKKLDFHFTSGGGFPDNVNDFALVIHCGGCMLNSREVQRRMKICKKSGVPFTNYGTAIAHIKGILPRSLEIFNKQRRDYGRKIQIN